MNKQIRELFKQATGSQTPHVSDLDTPAKIERFAELIVKECIEVAGASYTSTPEDCVYYVDLAVNRIAEHFGVEE